MKKALKIGIMGMIGFMLFVYGGLNGYCLAWRRLYGDFDSFASDDAGLPPWQKPDIPWDDVQDEAAQNFDVR